MNSGKVRAAVLGGNATQTSFERTLLSVDESVLLIEVLLTITQAHASSLSSMFLSICLQVGLEILHIALCCNYTSINGASGNDA